MRDQLFRGFAAKYLTDRNLSSSVVLNIKECLSVESASYSLGEPVDKADGQDPTPSTFLQGEHELARLIRSEFSWVEPLNTRGPNLVLRGKVPRCPLLKFAM